MMVAPLLMSAGTEVARMIMLSSVGAEHRKFVEASRDARIHQHLQLRRILECNSRTEYGRRFSFGQIRGLREFQRNVPITTYETLRPFINRMMQGEEKILTEETPYQYVLTSGSSSEPKFVPVTTAFRREYASRLQFYYLYRDFPRIFRPGAVLSMISPAIEGRTSAGVPYGAASGLTYTSQNRLIRSIYAIPYDVFTIKNFEAKYYAILRLALDCDVKVIVMANPSSILMLVNEMNRHSDRLIEDVARGTMTLDIPLDPSIRRCFDGRLKRNPARARELSCIRRDFGGTLPPEAVWRNLSAVVCWHDASAGLYLPDLKKAFKSIPTFNLGYAASEGLGTFRLADYNVEVLAITGHFFEFCELSEIESTVGRAVDLCLCDELQVGKRYFIIMSTSGGLYRYHIDDILEVQGFVNRTPVLKFVQKGTNSYSFTGEKLAETQVIEGVKSVMGDFETPCMFFSVVPVFDKTPYYRVFVESERRLDASCTAELGRRIDNAFCQLNVEFEAKRASHRIGPTQICALPSGFFDRYSRAVYEEKRAAQVKFRYLNPEPLFFRVLESFDKQENSVAGGSPCE